MAGTEALPTISLFVNNAGEFLRCTAYGPVAFGHKCSLRTLGPVLEWLRVQDPPRVVRDIVTQDEYTHDVVLPFDGEHFLVFDAT